MPTSTLTVIHPRSSAEEYVVMKGIDEEHIDKLVLYAREDGDVKTHTSDLVQSDGRPGRFSSLEAYENWLKKGRSIYTLLDKENTFCGIIWFSHEPQVLASRTYDFTFGIRLYGHARGIGLAKPFSQTTLKHFRGSDEYRKSTNQGIWLRTDQNNVAAISTYYSLGYIKVVSDSQTHKITMVLQ